jgi:hypothetical protein
MIKLLGHGWERDSETQKKIYNAMEATEAASHRVMNIIDQMVVEKHGKG